MSALVRLVYSSRPTPLATPSSIDRIVEAAQAFNRANHVTGRLLVVLDESDEMLAFLQWIEGPHASIEACMRRIERDPRHRQIRIARRGPVDARAYPQWTLGYERIPVERLNEVLEGAGVRPIVETDGTILLV